MRMKVHNNYKKVERLFILRDIVISKLHVVSVDINNYIEILKDLEKKGGR